ncbi:2-(3-amino-3-carboxypropyl)histidine synthase subunit 2 [Condylostylus longicornis]|uniref:2-(3-amino-3-carboxypropyl)histidine synthase subunit 2 n=1 Tax=Condylostylus longicornis TaxID=2530218 RepID=UPI00244DA69E|nr:2-(3-amino-3-carboxypropyl)histidine synthase subunit 2 [Condylostylus longicornis]
MSTSAFFSPENAFLERNVEIIEEEVKFEEIWTEVNRSKCLDWIEKNNLKNVCLQFPDNYLPFSAKIHDDLKNKAKIYILADTSYGSCCVDEIGAAHVNADSIIHFGNACQSKVSRLSVLYIFAQKYLDFKKLYDDLNKLESSTKQKEIFIYFSQDYHHLLDKNLIKDFKNSVPKLSITLEKYPNSREKQNSENSVIKIFVGKDDQHFFNLTMTESASNWYLYNSEEALLKEINPITTTFIRRRYYYIEKCKDAKRLGIVVATLSADGYLDIVKHIQQLARAHGIRSYILSVGRINSAKLANFMEIDCFVLVGCPFNNIYTSKEFYKPIISIFEAELALNPAWLCKFPEKYVTDFKELLPNGSFYNEIDPQKIQKNDMSLVSGKIRHMDISNDDDAENTSRVLLEKKNYELVESTATSFEDRSWKGLEQNLGETDPAVIAKGLCGIPMSYTHDSP